MRSSADHLKCWNVGFWDRRRAEPEDEITACNDSSGGPHSKETGAKRVDERRLGAAETHDP
jgi:hypothetical protein